MRWWERAGAWDETHRVAIDTADDADLGLVVVSLSGELTSTAGPIEVASWASSVSRTS